MLAAVLRETRLVLQDKRHLDDARQAGRHEGVAEHLVGHGADHQLLRMGGHRPAGDEDDKTGDKVALRRAVPVLTEPHADQAGAPPDDAHGGVLPVVPNPGSTPAVLSEGVDATPGGDDGAVEELLAAAGSAEPQLADQQENGQEHAVGDESAAHNEMRQALPQMVPLAEAQCGDAAKDHLHPCVYREGLAVDAVQDSEDGSDATVDALLEVQLQVDTQYDLRDHEKEEGSGGLCVDVLRVELPALMEVAESVTEEGEGRGKDL